jgi:hypothetical protein
MNSKHAWALVGCFWAAMVFPVVSNSQIKSNKNNPYKQILIPLDKLKGVPFSKDDRGEFTIEGFEIDNNENFFFLGDRKATLAGFSKDGKSIFRKTYLDLTPGEMHIIGNKLYFFEISQDLIYTLVELDKTSGLVNKKYTKTITKELRAPGRSIEYYQFNDSVLKIICIDGGDVEKPKAICFNFKGELLSNCRQYDSNSAAIDNENEYGYTGRLANNYVLAKFSEDSEKFELSLRDSSNAVISNAFIEMKYAGKPFCGHLGCMPSEHRKVRNNKLYLLNRDKNMAVITVVDLADIFHVK